MSSQLMSSLLWMCFDGLIATMGQIMRCWCVTHSRKSKGVVNYRFVGVSCSVPAALLPEVIQFYILQIVELV